jgi:hypothetical protein
MKVYVLFLNDIFEGLFSSEWKAKCHAESRFGKPTILSREVY